MSVSRNIDSVIVCIRVMVNVEIKSVLEEGRAKEETVASLRKRIKEEIFMVYRLVPLIRRDLSDNTFSVYIYAKFRELLEIVGDFGSYGYPAGLKTWPDESMVWIRDLAFQELQELLDWMHRIYYAHLRDLVIVPQGYCLIARHRIREYLVPAAMRLLEQDADPELLTVLTQPYNDLSRESRSGPLSYHFVRNLKRLYQRLYTISHDPQCDDINGAMRDLLWSFNVNTPQALAYSKRLIKAELQDASDPATLRQVMDRYSKLLRQLKPEEDSILKPERKTLTEHLIDFVDLECTYLPANAKDATAAGNGDSEPLLLNIPNEHYAALARVMQESEIFQGSKREVAKKTGKLFRSRNNQPIGIPAHEQNVKRPTQSAVSASWNIHMKSIAWMVFNWREYGVPDLFAMNEKQLKKYISDLEDRFRPKK